MDLDFRGRAVIVTGGGSGLGRHFALEFARRGASVLVDDWFRDEDRAARVTAEIVAEGGVAVASSESVATEEGGEAIVQAALEAFGRVDVLVQSAGCLRDRSVAKLTSEELHDVLDVNLIGAFNVALPAYRTMRSQGGGSIILLSSAAGIFGNPGQANYAAAKMGLLGLSSVLAHEGERHGIRSNVVSPYARTPISAEFLDSLGLDLQPEHIAPLVTVLAASECVLTRRVFSAGGGHFAAVVIGRGQGWTAGGDRRPTAEDVAGHMDEILDASQPVFPASAQEELALLTEKLRS